MYGPRLRADGNSGECCTTSCRAEQSECSMMRDVGYSNVPLFQIWCRKIYRIWSSGTSASILVRRSTERLQFRHYGWLHLHNRLQTISIFNDIKKPDLLRKVTPCQAEIMLPICAGKFQIIIKIFIYAVNWLLNIHGILLCMFSFSHVYWYCQCCAYAPYVPELR
jgi:hypothetical protein